MLKELIERFREKNNKFSDFDEFENHQEKFFMRKLSHNERALMKFNEEERQKQIADELRLAKLKRQFEERQKSRDLMKFNSGIFNEDVILSQENIFR